jgi:hypothetical protein
MPTRVPASDRSEKEQQQQQQCGGLKYFRECILNSRSSNHISLTAAEQQQQPQL